MTQLVALKFRSKLIYAKIEINNYEPEKKKINN